MHANLTPERQRLIDAQAGLADWKNWGPYLSERAWGTVREDYSATGEAWEYFPHDHARSRVFRWNEDGLGGFCNRYQNLCLAVALWNGHDSILKERLFGLTGNQGNHGEDVKEVYFYLDSTPTHSYARMLYRYPQVAFPYDDLVSENQRRGRGAPEYELLDALAEVFAKQRYFDVVIEYAKAGPEDVLCRISAINRGPAPAPIHILPQVWFRNTWSWGYHRPKPEMRALEESPSPLIAGLRVRHRHLGERWWYVRKATGGMPPPLLFTENETNYTRLFGSPNPTPFVKDGINDAVVAGQMGRVNPDLVGTKAAAHAQTLLGPGEVFTLQVRFTDTETKTPFEDFDRVFSRRQTEADAFYATVQNPALSEDARNIQRQAFAGLMWTKQFYHYSVQLWLNGDPAGPPPPASRKWGRNRDWTHLDNLDIISMPDKWEYPWYAAWDLAFHTVPIALVDPDFAKEQLILMLREWYMHPNGQLPAYEWAFGDVNPPVHAWAVWRVYKITRNVTGQADRKFLERAFHKLLLNFTWWVNRKDADGNNIFQGGFLGLDNIGVFDRSAPLPTGGHIEQADGTAWMGFFCLNMLAIALELARTNPAYEDIATKFFEHFVYIANAINAPHEHGGLWDEEDGFYYDKLHLSDDRFIPMRIRSFVGLIPLFAVETLEPDILELLPHFDKRMKWFIQNRPNLVRNVASLENTGAGDRLLLSMVDREKLERILERMLAEGQFLSPYGLRSLSREHESQPFTFAVNGHPHTVRYEPAESRSEIFGGNSNWRGPIWFPVNYLMIESLQKYHHYFGDSLKVALPSGSGNRVDLWQVATDLSLRLVQIFLKNSAGERAFYPKRWAVCQEADWQDHILFYEYFHGDQGTGIGASHQTGWTALVAKLIQQCGNELKTG